ncbi:MAG: TVP38/TMEM64 family protein [Verrucomicrobia bacterium]|nr:TVP38/TMEM64 family protein [Verrucomicrobiota bacterium]MCH8527218.1 VTT domain-containing protein [Kiritimatiellia bacterium]
MSSRNTLILLFVLLSALIIISFSIWGSGFDALFSLEGSTRFFERYSHLAGPLGAGLLIADLVLPIPSTGVLGGMGAVMGVGPAFLWGWAGLVLSGTCGYGSTRWGGTRWASKLAPEEERQRYQHLFNTWGSLAIVITRLLPILPEVLSVLSGLYGMKFSRFFGATLVGSLAPALAYTWLGAQAREHPGPAIWGIVFLTTLAWLAFLYLRRSVRSV